MRALVAASGISERGAGVCTGVGALAWRSGWLAGGVAGWSMTCLGGAGVVAATFFLAHPIPMDSAAMAIRIAPRERVMVIFSIASIHNSISPAMPILFGQDF